MDLDWSLAEKDSEHAIDMVAFGLYYLAIEHVIIYNIATSNIDLQDCPSFILMSSMLGLFVHYNRA